MDSREVIEQLEASAGAQAQVWRDLLDSPGWAVLVHEIKERRQVHLTGLDSTARTKDLAEVRALQARREELKFIVEMPARKIAELTGTTIRRPSEVTRGEDNR